MKNLYLHALGGVKGVSNRGGYQYELNEWGYNLEKMDSVSMYRLK